MLMKFIEDLKPQREIFINPDNIIAFQRQTNTTTLIRTDTEKKFSIIESFIVISTLQIFRSFLYIETNANIELLVNTKFISNIIPNSFGTSTILLGNNYSFATKQIITEDILRQNYLLVYRQNYLLV